MVLDLNDCFREFMNYRIITIEDDLILAQDLHNKLKLLGYLMLGNATNTTEAIAMVTKESPDVIIADIQIEGSKDGVDTIYDIYKNYICPVIYLTANTDAVTVKRALATGPAAFLLKPYKISEFAINIDLAIANFREQMSFEKANSRITDSIFIPQQFLYHRLWKKDIKFIEADGAYVKVHTKDKKYQITVNLKGFERQLNDSTFFRVSRKHLINTQYITRINGNSLFLQMPGQKEELITIGKEQRQEILSRFTILKTRD